MNMIVWQSDSAQPPPGRPGYARTREVRSDPTEESGVISSGEWPLGGASEGVVAQGEAAAHVSSSSTGFPAAMRHGNYRKSVVTPVLPVDQPIASPAMISTINAWADQAAVRARLVRTSARCAPASNPEESRRCSGTWTAAVEIHVRAAAVAPAMASHIGQPPGNSTTNQTDEHNSAIIAGPTTGPVRRTCSACYFPNDPGPTSPSSG